MVATVGKAYTQDRIGEDRVTLPGFNWQSYQQILQALPEHGKEWRIYQLQGKIYEECDRSPLFPWVKKVYLYEFLAQAEQDEMEAEKTLRDFVCQNIKRDNG